jgi:thiamine-monophosphate kinase
MPGEFDFIDWIRSQQKPSAMVPLPAGDDLAVLKWPASNLLLVGIDQVLDSVHFDTAQHSPREIGRKAMNRNLSDCAAMACLPSAAVVSVALPRNGNLEYAKELYLGLRDAADPFGCEIVGGDTGSWDGKLALTVAILGRSDGIEPITRKNARPGERIYVTGPLGGSILGRHLSFTPRIVKARQLASNYAISAMIDISDGLSRDLRHICRQSNVGAVIDADKVPIHPDTHLMPPPVTRASSPCENRQHGQDARVTTEPLEHALHDGEDHELLFTTAAGIPADQATEIGVITAEPGIFLLDSSGKYPLEPKGWEHRL